MSLHMAAVLEVMLAVHFHELDTGVVAIVSAAVVCVATVSLCRMISMAICTTLCCDVTCFHRHSGRLNCLD